MKKGKSSTEVASMAKTALRCVMLYGSSRGAGGRGEDNGRILQLKISREAFHLVLPAMAELT